MARWQMESLSGKKNGSSGASTRLSPYQCGARAVTFPSSQGSPAHFDQLSLSHCLQGMWKRIKMPIFMGEECMGWQGTAPCTVCVCVCGKMRGEGVCCRLVVFPFSSPFPGSVSQQLFADATQRFFSPQIKHMIAVLQSIWFGSVLCFYFLEVEAYCLFSGKRHRSPLLLI